jgi:2'-5' RNA ligase
MKNNATRYVIVCLINSEVRNFHNNLTTQVCSLFNVKRQRLPAHFTIKAPFETENVSDLENVTEEFCTKNKSYPIIVEGFGHFSDAVVFMNVKPSQKAEDVHDRYIDELSKISWLDWKAKEGKGKKFHCTIVSKLKSDKFKDIWDYCNKHHYSFHTFFDNITIMKWEQDKWIVYKSLQLSK